MTPPYGRNGRETKETLDLPEKTSTSTSLTMLMLMTVS